MTILEEFYRLCNTCNGDISKDDLVAGKCIWCWEKEERDGE